MKVSWVSVDRICQEKAEASADVRRELERTGKPLRSRSSTTAFP